jgi:hypothetical protein
MHKLTQKRKSAQKSELDQKAEGKRAKQSRPARKQEKSGQTTAHDTNGNDTVSAPRAPAPIDTLPSPKCSSPPAHAGARSLLWSSQDIKLTGANHSSRWIQSK